MPIDSASRKSGYDGAECVDGVAKDRNIRGYAPGESHWRLCTFAVTPTSTAKLAWYFQVTQHLIGKPFRGFWKSRSRMSHFRLRHATRRMPCFSSC